MYEIKAEVAVRNQPKYTLSCVYRFRGIMRPIQLWQLQQQHSASFSHVRKISILSEKFWQFDEIRYLRISKYVINKNNLFFSSDIEFNPFKN